MIAYLAHPLHHLTELGEVDCARPVDVHLVDHVEELLFGGILTERPHRHPQLFGGN